MPGSHSKKDKLKKRIAKVRKAGSKFRPDPLTEAENKELLRSTNETSTPQPRRTIELMPAKAALRRRRDSLIRLISGRGAGPNRSTRPAKSAMTWSGPVMAKTNISATFPIHAKYGPTDRATAATLCWVKNALHCASPRPWRARRAGWRSTCSSSA